MGDIRYDWTQIEVDLDLMSEVDYDNLGFFSKIEEWLDENIDGDYLLLPYVEHFIESHNEMPMSCFFKNGTDATAFKLTWS